ncbi:MAG: MBL fold metallo-hydrolase [bacterium]|nr:MBL fold metallo-hydrolase [bacterium]
MYLQWLGLNCFKITTNDTTLITDPYDSSTGLNLPRLQANIVTVSNPDEAMVNNIEKIGGEPYIVSGPGEYEASQVFIRGVVDQVNGQPVQPGFSTQYYFEVDKISIAHLGLLNHQISTKALEVFEGVDVLLIPVGGISSLDPEKASAVISQIEPRVIIPMFYASSGLKLKLGNIDAFLKTMGAKDPETTDKLRLLKKDLPQEDTKIIVLKA